MNKQEAIEKIKKQSTQAYDDFAIMRDTAIHIINQIDEPQKPVIPKFVAEWLDILDEHGLFGLNYDIVDESVQNWVYENYDCNAKKLHLAYLFGYEIEQEKLYTVEIPNPNLNAHVVLQKTVDGLVLVTVGNAGWAEWESSKVTEAEIKKDFDFLWQFKKEVER